MPIFCVKSVKIYTGARDKYEVCARVGCFFYHTNMWRTTFRQRQHSANIFVIQFFLQPIIFSWPLLHSKQNKVHKEIRKQRKYATHRKWKHTNTDMQTPVWLWQTSDRSSFTVSRREILPPLSQITILNFQRFSWSTTTTLWLLCVNPNVL